jgi:hypothetical protein
VTQRERIQQEVLHRRAQVAVLFGLAAGEDVYGLMTAAAPSHVPGTGRSNVLRAARDLAHDLAEAGEEDDPEMIHSRAEITRLRTHPA